MNYACLFVCKVVVLRVLRCMLKIQLKLVLEHLESRMEWKTPSNYEKDLPEKVQPPNQYQSLSPPLTMIKNINKNFTFF